MTSENTGAQTLIERILSAARQEAAACMAAAEESCAAIQAQSEARIRAVAAEEAQKRAAARQDILERSRTNAELAARKNELAARRALIDEAFGQAYARLCALQGEPRADICRGMLLREADGGEVVHASKNDFERIGRLMPDINAAMTKAGKKPLRLAPGAVDITGGFLLSGDGYEKDCSFAMLLGELRAREETSVASILFGEPG
jgi:V/A-type H+-transporting ATPase subunit E